MTEPARRVEPMRLAGRTTARPGDWTEARVAHLRQLWEVDGRSASQIAETLGDVTRNAVINKVSRLGLVQPKHKRIVPGRFGGARGAGGAAPALATDPAGEASPALAAEPVPVARPWRDKGYRTKPPTRGWADGSGLSDRSPFATCQYLRGEPERRDFCGAAVLERRDGRRSSYCPEHHALCWETHVPRPKPATKDAA
ncbi:GcrA family cell cycle regulator [Inquilinus sp. CA228]|uniref:GcrA family cell cycle regulator n=1 Tax=Inquilinus sp. CA228 TaxID=3455609 RepID=UPI003F8D8CAA